VIGITESWAHEEIDDALIAITGYNMYRYRDPNRVDIRGGGVLLYIADSLESEPVITISDIQPQEAIWRQINSTSAPVVVGVVYRSTADQSQVLPTIFNEASKHHTVVMGDFNYRSIDWSSMHCDSDSRPFLESVEDNFLTQHVDKPTREENILDLILSTEPGMVENLEVREKLGKSDHNIVTWTLVCEVSLKVDNSVKRDYNRGDYEGFNKYLTDTDWKENCGTVNDMWSLFRGTLDSGIDTYIPTQRSYRKRKALWMTRHAEKARRCKYKHWRRYRESQLDSDYVDYKRASNKATKAIRTAKKDFELKLAQNIKTDTKSFYAYARSKYKTKDKVGPLTDVNNEVIRDDSIAAGQLNDFFTSVFTREPLEMLPTPEPIFEGETYEALENIVFDSTDVLKRLQHLRPDKAPGPDGMKPRLLQEIATSIAVQVTNIFTKSCELGEVPTDWKRANVTPLFKKGKRNLAANYRPISLTAQLCKVMEGILRDNIVKHLHKHQLIRDTQHGFMSGRSCLTNLLAFLESVTAHVDEGYPVDVVYLDFAKAFDKVPHARLVSKLQAHGITGKVAAWISNWLQDRKQRVVLNGETSEWSDVSSGVPQGSVLGPVLFLIYINDIDIGISSQILKFADDTKAVRKIGSESDAQALQQDLHNMFAWSQEWLMLFNVAKCKVLHIGRNNPRYEYEMNGVKLEAVEEERDLGVSVSSSLKSASHCSTASKKANRALGLIQRAFRCRNKQFVLPLYIALVRPHLDYCVQAWRPHYAQDIQLLERVQRRFTRMVHGLGGLPYEQRLQRLNLTTIETRHIRADLLEAFKIIRGKEKLDPTTFFTFSSYSRTKGHQYKLYKPRARLDCRKYFFSHRVVDLWNELPNDAVSCETTDQFKRHLDKFLHATCQGQSTWLSLCIYWTSNVVGIVLTTALKLLLKILCVLFMRQYTCLTDPYDCIYPLHSFYDSFTQSVHMVYCRYVVVDW
jgi:ribonuclease P/MRP protein subunit RPP40